MTDTREDANRAPPIAPWARRVEFPQLAAFVVGISFWAVLYVTFLLRIVFGPSIQLSPAIMLPWGVAMVASVLLIALKGRF